MRTNIILTLIIAFLLVVGWSLFTLYQDLSKSENGSISGEMIITGVKEYMPVAPFPKGIKTETERNLALNDKPAETSTEKYTGDTPDKVLEEDEGDALEGVEETENTNAFNYLKSGLPVGDGLIFLLLMAGLYVSYQMLIKKNNRLDY